MNKLLEKMYNALPDWLKKKEDRGYQDKRGWKHDGEKKVLCTYCNKPILAVEFGGIAKEGMFHTKCFQELCLHKEIIQMSDQLFECESCHEVFTEKQIPGECLERVKWKEGFTKVPTPKDQPFFCDDELEWERCDIQCGACKNLDRNNLEFIDDE